MSLRVTHVITGLDVGGAEVLLAQTLERLDGARYSSAVISLSPPGPLAPRIEASGAPLFSAGLGPVPGPVGMTRLARLLRRTRPDVVQTWLLHANVLGGLVARGATRAPVSWGVHITQADPAIYGRRAALVQGVERRLSRTVPAAIVACSETAVDAMRDMGYPESRIVPVLNGFDTERFRPDEGDRNALREELGVAPDAIVIGHVARLHPMKDQRNLLLAAPELIERHPEAVFVLAGLGLERDNPEIASLAEPLGDRVRLLGPRDDVPRLLRSFDLFALPSAAGEALPLVVGEAMCTGVPVCATDVGDSPNLVADIGRVVPPRDPSALAGALAELCDLGHEGLRTLGAEARSRMIEHYALDDMVAGYAAVWDRLAASRSA